MESKSDQKAMMCELGYFFFIERTKRNHNCAWLRLHWEIKGLHAISVYAVSSNMCGHMYKGIHLDANAWRVLDNTQTHLPLMQKIDQVCGNDGKLRIADQITILWRQLWKLRTFRFLVIIYLACYSLN